MALKHYGGARPEPQGTWVCPTCQAENSTPLKAGCQTCGAGADAKGPGQAVQPPIVGPRVATAAPVRPEYLGFDEWQRQYPEAQDLLEAFMAGVAWARKQPTGGSTPAPVDPEVDLPADPAEILPLLGAQTLATLVAALVFYRDNQLQYGPIPGQLDAEQVTELITRLTPQETEA